MDSHATWVSAGRYFTCGVRSGIAKCWGYNASGQLGDGTNGDRHRPHRVAFVGGRTTIVNAGSYSTCALRKVSQGNAAFCWGTNVYGDLGDGTNDPSPLPVGVKGMSSGVTSITPYYNTTCAVQRGAAKCWGYNIYGMVGDGSTKERHAPRQVVGLTDHAVKASTGFYSSCALLDTGGIRCWGFGDDGQLGNGKDLNHPTPVRVHLT